MRSTATVSTRLTSTEESFPELQPMTVGEPLSIRPSITLIAAAANGWNFSIAAMRASIGEAEGT
ncbi:hypothetical protein APY03_7514 [Variovorax sp. WDL1]|nr:hypothetical protein APY03_7514 [Variovorax sp. WDL1]